MKHLVHLDYITAKTVCQGGDVHVWVRLESFLNIYLKTVMKNFTTVSFDLYHFICFLIRLATTLSLALVLFSGES